MICNLPFKESLLNSKQTLIDVDAIDEAGVIINEPLFDEWVDQMSTQASQAYNLDNEKLWFKNPIVNEPIVPNEEQFNKIDEKRKLMGLYEDQISGAISLEEPQVIPPDEQVVYQLRVVNALQSDKIRQPKLNNLQGFYNDLQKQGIPNQQVDLVKDILSDAKEGITKEDIIRELLVRYSYSVEVNTAKKQLKSKQYREDDDNYQQALYDDYRETDGRFEDVEKEPTSYYSNLTVPGGTNYREVEIRTPGIVPSITGHAQFSTKEGIGWFRASDRVTYTNKEELINLLKNSKLLEIDCS